MAGESLLTLAEVLASLPDNNSNLIDPLDHRNEVISLVNDVAFLEEDDPFVIPITDGVFVSINLQLVTPEFLGNGWSLDGNNAFFTDFGVVTINPGLERLLSMQCSILLNKQGGGTSDYTFQFHVAGAPVGRVINIAEISTAQQEVTFEETLTFDYSIGITDPVTIQVRGDGTGDDLDVDDFSMKLVGVII